MAILGNVTNSIYLVPQWFVGVDIILQFLFALVAGVVAYYAIKIYRISMQKDSELLGAAFILIALSYIQRALLNLYALGEAREGYCELSLANTTLLGVLGVYIHVILFTAGLITLVYMTGKTKSDRLYSLLLITSIVLLLLSCSLWLAFNIISVIFIGYVLFFYLEEYNKNKNKQSLLLIIVFALLLASQLFNVLGSGYVYSYFVSHMLELGSYLLLSIGLYTIVRNSRRK